MEKTKEKYKEFGIIEIERIEKVGNELKSKIEFDFRKFPQNYGDKNIEVLNFNSLNAYVLLSKNIKVEIKENNDLFEVKFTLKNKNVPLYFKAFRTNETEVDLMMQNVANQLTKFEQMPLDEFIMLYMD